MQICCSLKFLVSCQHVPEHQKAQTAHNEGHYSPVDVQMFWYTPPINTLMKRESNKSLAKSKDFYWHYRLETRYLNDFSKATEMEVQDIPLPPNLPIEIIWE